MKHLYHFLLLLPSLCPLAGSAQVSLPEGGTTTEYMRQSDVLSYYNNGTANVSTQYTDYGYATQIVTYDDGTVYLVNPLFTRNFNEDFAIQGRRDGDVITVEFPQTVRENASGQAFTLDRLIWDANYSDYVPDTTRCITWTVGEDGTIVMEPTTTDNWFVMGLMGPDGLWWYEANYNQILTPHTAQVLTTLPEGLPSRRGN